MIRSGILFLLGCIPLSSAAQGLQNNGAYIVMNGAAANIYIDGSAGGYTSNGAGVINPLVNGPTVTLLGNWTNNAGNFGFGAEGVTVVMAGANQTIGGSSTTTFYNLTLQGSGTKTLNYISRTGGIGPSFNGVLNLGSRPLDLNGFRLEIRNPANTAITSTTGYIQSETNASYNPSQLYWYIGANTGTYVMPFGVAATQLPLTVNLTSGMVPGAYFYASTRATATSANTPWTTGVSHMFDPTLLQDGSDEAVIDRWWDFEFSSAVTADVTFSYRGSENTLQVPYNTGNLGAQWWATGWFPDNSNIGSSPAVLAGVGNVTASGLVFPASTVTPMVLSSVQAPLPIELTSFTANCNNQEVIKWSTASEMNNDYFTVQRSDDGTAFHDIGQVNGSGTTTQLHNYSFIDPQPVTGAAYYRLKQTDLNGQFSISAVIAGENCAGSDNYFDAYHSGNGIDILMNVQQDDDYSVTVFDDRGRVIIIQDISAAKGANHFLLNGAVPATGIYLVRITGKDGNSFIKRLFIAVE